MHCIDLELGLHLIRELGRLPLARATTCFAHCTSMDLSFFMDFEHVHLFSLHLMCQLDNIGLLLLHFILLLDQREQQGQNLLHLGVWSKLTFGLHLILAEGAFLLAK